MKTINKRTAYALANLADCSCPDTDKSAGADFLRGVQDDVLERLSDGSADEDAAHEIADGAVPVYTHDLWQTFTDLAAYNEDPTELGYDGSDMDAAARTCLYLIAHRLVLALLEEAQDEDDEDDED